MYFRSSPLAKHITRLLLLNLNICIPPPLPPAETGGLDVVRYLVQWDVEATFRNIATSGYEATVAATPGAARECYDIQIAAVSASVPRFVRVAAYNGYDHSPFEASLPASASQYARGRELRHRRDCRPRQPAQRGRAVGRLRCRDIPCALGGCDWPPKA